MFKEEFWDCSELYLPFDTKQLVYTFKNMVSLKLPPHIPSRVTLMLGTFMGCQILEEAPVIPDSVTDMESAFNSCYSLKKVPNIPNNVTNMEGTFKSCSSLKMVPDIADSVTNMHETFWGCVKLEKAPIIGSGVIDMSGTFAFCDELKGDVYIYSDNVKNCEHCFAFHESNELNLYIHKDTTTWNTFEEYLANKQFNIHMKELVREKEHNRLEKEAQSLFGKMRDATVKELVSVKNYIKKISKDTGRKFREDV